MTSPVGRLMSPQLSFASAMKGAADVGSQAKTTITKTEAETALAQLSGHPHADAAQRATIVQAFLDGTDSATLSPRARDVLADFVSRQTAAGGGQRADELKAAAALSTRGAADGLAAARARLDALVAEGARLGKADLKPAQQALDGARAAVDAARGNLGGALKVADHAASLADQQLAGAAADIARASADLQRLVAGKAPVTSGSVDALKKWLAEPMPELAQAQAQLQPQTQAPSGPDMQTMRYPSDNEDDGGSVAAPDVQTKRYPSDNEDDGGSVAGPDVQTMRFPSDNEDDGGAVAGPDVQTKRYPSDNDDGGTAQQTGGPDVQTMRFPSDNEDDGGAVQTGGVNPPPPPGILRAQQMLQVFEAASSAGTLQWTSSLPMGARYEEIFLTRDNHVDGFTTTAMVPVGALSPSAPRADVDSVDTFFVRRTGGIAGITQFAGPLSL